MLTAKPFGHARFELISGPVGSEKTQEIESFLDSLVGSGYKRNGNILVVRHPKDDPNPYMIGRHEVKVTDTPQEIAAHIHPETETVIIAGISHYQDKSIVQLIDAINRSGRKATATGLNVDIDGDPHGHMADLMGIATHITLMKAECHICGDTANRSMHLKKSNQYVPVCSHHAAHPQLPAIQAGQAGNITVYAGSMYASKSTTWSKNVNRGFQQNHNPLVFKPIMDTRDGIENPKVFDTGYVTLHSGKRIEAILVENASQIDEYLEDHPKVRTIKVDEVQFMNGIYEFALRNVSRGYKISVNGLPRGFNRGSFNEAPKLMCLADKIHMNYAICVHQSNNIPCGKPATESQRLKRITDEGPIEIAHVNDPLVLVGGRDEKGAKYFYEARCLEHWSLQGEPKNPYQLPPLDHLI